MGIRRSGATPSERGLRALGDQIEGHARAEHPGTQDVAGGDRLRALGDAIDGRRAGGGGRAAGGGGRGGGRGGSRGGTLVGGGGGRSRPRWSTRRKILTPLVALLVLALLTAGALYFYARYRYGQIEKVTVADLHPVGSGQPFNMLVIGSDSRLGAKASTGVGSSTTVTGQRSDVVMIWHVVPATRKITILSIPRDTMTQMVGKDASEFGRFNRINASYNSGPSYLVRTIQDNFGIPISHVVEVNFSGFKGAVDALGGVYMNFRYPARDAWSGLQVPTAGCRLLNGTEALAVARSRHYQYEVNGQWVDTPVGDLGRIKRQDAFLRALVDAAKRDVNPLRLNAFLGSLPQGLVIDKTLSLGEMFRLAIDFHSLTPNSITTYTLPTTTVGAVTPWGDVLFVSQPADQQLLVRIFGNELIRPTAPPPGPTLHPEQPPSVPAGATSGTGSAGSGSSGSGGGASTASTQSGTPTFDPTPCSP
jgi:LCP family protein required for cell wall assembly